MLAPDSRALLLDAVRPPAGCTLDRAVATTFTLDLASALMVPLAFAGYRLRDTLDPIELMEALRESGKKFDVFCQAGAIGAAEWPSDLVALLEDVVHEARRPRPGYVFHPKTWVLRFVDEAVQPTYRLLVLSRNLTSDRSWDTILWLDGTPGTRVLAENAPLSSFVGALAATCVSPLDKVRRDAIEQLARDLRRVEWERPAGVRDVYFHPMGLPGIPRFDAGVLSSGYRQLVVSPFVRAGAVGRLFGGTTSTSPPVLVSRGEELDALPPGTLDGIQAFQLDPMASLGKDGENASSSTAMLSNLHAKIFVVERARLAHLFVGSANATDAGLGNNVEFLCELVGSPSSIGVTAFVGEGSGFLEMLQPYVLPLEPVLESERDRAGRALEALLMDIAQVGFRVEVLPAEEGWAPRVTSDAALPSAPEGTSIRIAPHNRHAEAVSIAGGEPVDVGWPSRDAADVTPFIQLVVSRTVAGETIERSAVLCAPMVGAPSSRLEDIFVRQLDSPEKFMRLLALLLGLGMPGQGTDAGDAIGGTWFAGQGTGVLELLARALAERPEAIDHLASIVGRLRGTDRGRAILPAGWDGVWLPVLEARTRLAEASA